MVTVKKKAMEATSTKTVVTRASLIKDIVEARTVVKGSSKNPAMDDGVLAYDTPYELTFASAKVEPRFNKDGVQAVFTLSGDDVTTTVSLDLPFEDDLAATAAGLSAEDIVRFDKSSREKCYKMLRAALPEIFSMAASIDKSDPSNWVYLGWNGEEMTEDDRATAAAEINRAVEAAVRQFRAGDFSLVLGVKVQLIRKKNPRSERFPYNNFYSIGYDTQE